MTKRGTGNGQYVMARKGDKGPYASWNVECITTNQNSQDKKQNGTARTKRIGPKLTKAMIQDIFQSTDAQNKIAKKYKITVTTVSKIKTGATRARATAGLVRGRYFNSFR